MVLADRSELVEELADELASGPVPALAVTADLEAGRRCAKPLCSRRLSTLRSDRRADQQRGRRDQLQTVHRVQRRRDPRRDRPLADDDAVRAAAPRCPSWSSAGRGVIVNVSSAATRGIHRIPYSAAKGGINAITASLAMEYADAGIRVVATAPGGTEAPPRRISRGTPEPPHRHRAGLVPGAHRPDPRLVAAQAVRHARRTGGGDLLPGLRRGVLHHRDGAARRRWRPRLTDRNHAGL